MLKNNAIMDASPSDADLVAQCLRGSRDAFGVIVSRYQSLICSIAYSATGCLSRSEDLAQETFFTAWKKMSDLREPGSLRAWLCGIARNLVNNSLRREGREPVTVGDSMEMAVETPAAEPLPADVAISREEESIMWRALERIPDLYREPLVLFYRENHSVEKVGDALGLSEDVVKQRLSRGRKLLQQEVAAFVENTLLRSGPGKAFTMGVMAGLPMLTTSVAAATVAGTAAQGSSVAKSAGILAGVAAVLAPFVGFISGYLGYRTSMNTAYTEEERRLVVSQNKQIWMGVGVYMAAFATVLGLGSFWKENPALLAVCAVVIPTSFVVWLFRLGFRFMTEMQNAAEKGLEAQRKLGLHQRPSRWFDDFKTKTCLFGLPLVHLRLGPALPDSKPAMGWIAVGDRAVGILFALGGGAMALVSIGGFSVGLISVGTVSVGVVSMGCISLGLLALGSMAFGIMSAGGFAAGWKVATGSLAVSREFAMGGTAIAQHANNEVAKQFFAANHLDLVVQILLVAVVLLTLVPIGYLAWITRKKVEADQGGTAGVVDFSAEASKEATVDNPARATAPERVAMWDYLRAFLTFLVVAHHAVLAYHSYAPPLNAFNASPLMWPAFPVVDSAKWKGIELLVGYNDTFFMSLMFLISGLFVWSSLKRKGAKGFLRDRVLRLGLPFAVGATLLAPLAYYPSYLQRGGSGGLSGYFTAYRSLDFWPAGPVWFIWVLLAFGALASLLFTVAPKVVEGFGAFLSRPTRSPLKFFLTLVVLSAAAYMPIARIWDPMYWMTVGPFAVQSSRIGHYGLYFLVGAALGSAGLALEMFQKTSKLAKRWPLWMGVSLVAYAITMAAFVMVLTLLSKGIAPGIWKTVSDFGFVLSCAASSMAFMALFARFADGGSRIMNSLSRNAFGIYLVHYIFVSWLQFALLNVSVPGSVKGLIVIMGGLGLSWGCVGLLRRLPGFRRIL